MTGWPIMRCKVLLVLLVAMAFGSQGVEADDDDPKGITGPERKKELSVTMGCEELASEFNSAIASSTMPFKTIPITSGGGYAYIQLHLTQLLLPVGASMVLRGVEDDGSGVVTNLTDKYPSGTLYGDFLAPTVKAKKFQIEIYRDYVASNVNSTASFDAGQCFGFSIDYYYYQLVDPLFDIEPANESICLNDDTVEAICYINNNPMAFRASMAVARILVIDSAGISRACTGWLLGNAGHLITNHHCIKDAGEAGRTTVEFMAQAATCSNDVNCKAWGACRGTVPTLSLKFLYTNENLDYTIVQLNAARSDLAPFGYLRLRSSAASVGEQVYIPQYPLYYGKRISLDDPYMNRKFVEILSTTATGCNTTITGYSYTGDTQGGSSGSPVISYNTNSVVALHFCGEACSNTGIPAVTLITDLNANGGGIGGVPASFDMIDNDGQNSAKFGVYTAPTPAPAVTMSPQFKFDGLIQVSSDNAAISVDHFEITVVNDCDVILDVISQEISDSNSFKDVNQDCKASYIDAVMYLFPFDSSAGSYSTKPTLQSLQRDGQTGITDASISKKDPYAKTSLQKNTYLLAIGAVGTKADEAYAGSQTLKASGANIYNCRDKATSGSYRLEISSSAALTIITQPTYTVTIPATCQIPATCS